MMTLENFKLNIYAYDIRNCKNIAINKEVMVEIILY